MRTMIAALALLGVAACSTAEGGSDAAQPQNAAEATAQDTCGASRFRHLIGTPLAGIDRSTLPAGTRLLTPDMMVTQDFRPDRLNVVSGTDGNVSSLACY